jgi:hypothetical protein
MRAARIIVIRLRGQAKWPLLLACLALASATSASAASPNTKRMVLTLSDLPAGYSLSKAYYANNERAAKEDSTPLASFVAWGRITGYEADFDKSGLAEIVSSSSLYRTARGAHLSLADSTHRVASKPSKGMKFTRLSTGGRIGQETFFYKITTTKKREVAYAVQWREQNVKAALLFAGLGLTDPALVIRLARKQEARIRRALGKS